MNQSIAFGVFVIVAVFTGAVTAPSAHAEPLKECLARAGASDEAAFLEFHGELRAAAASPDATLFSLLADYPLRVNDGGATTLVADARTLSSRMGEIFSSATRERVLNTKVEDLICTNGGIGYGRGGLWVAVRIHQGVQRFVIQAVNVPEGSRRPLTSVRFVCRTETSRMVIDGGSSGPVRLRSWSRPKFVMGRPDVEILLGSETLEGTGPCAHRVWRFPRSDGPIELSETGCSDGSDPTGVLGSVTWNAEEGRRSKAEWCF